MKHTLHTFRFLALIVTGLLLTSSDRCDAKGIGYSGRAIVFNLNLPGVDPLVLGDTGALPDVGGTREVNLDASPVSYLTFQSAFATTTGTNACAVSQVGISQMVLGFRSPYGQEHVLTLESLQMRASVCCFGNGVAFSPDVQWSGLSLDGTEIPFQVGLNQRVDFDGGHLVLNAQRNAAEGNAGTSDVSGISIFLDDTAVGIIGLIHADISCPSPNTPPVDAVSCDRAKGQGSIAVMPKKKGRTGGLKVKGVATFAFSGRRESTGEVGHLVYVDHLIGLRVVSTAARAYSSVGENSRRIAYDVKINGRPGVAFVIVTDNATPGAGKDTFSITLSNGYSAQGVLVTGNIKVFHCPPPILPD